MRRLFIILFFVLCITSVYSLKLCVEITNSDVNIRAMSSSLGSIVGKAHKGDIFAYKSTIGSWYEIGMFSGEYRYIHSDFAKVIHYDEEIFISDKSIIKFVDVLKECKERAFMKADEKYDFNSQMDKNIDYTKLLIDRYQLDMFHKWRIQPVQNKKIFIKYNKLIY